jgi:hypothetical protein
MKAFICIHSISDHTTNKTKDEYNKTSAYKDTILISEWLPAAKANTRRHAH